MVKFSTLDRTIPGLILIWDMEVFFRVRDRCIRTSINNSPYLGMSRLQSIVHKTWAHQDSNNSSQVIFISVLQLIIRKTWAYQLSRSIIRKTWTYHDSDLSFTRLAYQDSDQLITRLWHIKTLINHLQVLGIFKHMPIMSWICQSCQ